LLLWQHPWLTLAFALAILVMLIMAVRLIWRALRKVFTGHWMPGRGLLQDARCSAAHPPARLPPQE
jgi:arginine utilization protein RocB